jgi:hypothetical protein
MMGIHQVVMGVQMYAQTKLSGPSGDARYQGVDLRTPLSQIVPLLLDIGRAQILQMRMSSI